jgi:hypothetical protein
MTITGDLSHAPARIGERATALLGCVVVIAGGSLGLGVMTAYAQQRVRWPAYLLVDSAGPWVLAAFALAALTRTQYGAMLAGVASLSLLEIGYVLADQARGFGSGTASAGFWLAAALLAGPAVGLAGHWVRRGDVLAAALGTGLITGVLVGEAEHIRHDLSVATYAQAQLGFAAVLFLALAAWRFPRPGPVLIALAASVPAAYLVLVVLRLG